MRPLGTRGLTLIEVVAAMALLSVLTVAVLPLLVAATQAIAPRVASIDPTELRALSDQVLRDEHVLAGLAPGEERRLDWDLNGRRRTLTIECLPCTDASAFPHIWLQFTCGDVRVLRFQPQGDAETTPTKGASE